MAVEFAALLTERDIVVRYSTTVFAARENCCPKRFVSVHPRTVDSSVEVVASTLPAAHENSTSVTTELDLANLDKVDLVKEIWDGETYLACTFLNKLMSSKSSGVNVLVILSASR
jgi:hypothetical protein